MTSSSGPARERGGVPRPQDGAPSSIDVLAAQVRGGIDSQRWLLDNAHNYQSQEWDEYLRAAKKDAEKGYAALARLVARVTEAEEAAEAEAANAANFHRDSVAAGIKLADTRAALADARNALERIASNYANAPIAREVLARLDGNQP